MNKFHYYINKARESNASQKNIELNEDQIIKKIDNFENDKNLFNENILEDEEENFSVKKVINNINESDINDLKKAKQIKIHLTKANITDVAIVEKLVNTFGVEDNVKKELKKLYYNENENEEISDDKILKDLINTVGDYEEAWDIIVGLGNAKKAQQIINDNGWSKKYKEAQKDEDITELEFLNELDQKGKNYRTKIIKGLLKLSTPEEIQKTYNKFVIK